MNKKIYIAVIVVLSTLLIYTNLDFFNSDGADFSKYSEVITYDDEKFIEYLQSELDDTIPVKDFDYLLKDRLKKTDDFYIRGYLEMYSYNLFALEQKYKSYIEPFKGNLDTFSSLEELKENYKNDKMFLALMENIEEDDLFVRYINDDYYVNINFGKFFEKYGMYMEKDMQAYFSLQEVVENIAVVENDLMVIENMEKILLSYREFLTTYNTSSLYRTSVDTYLSHLSFYLGLGNSNWTSNDIIKDEYVVAYRDMLNRPEVKNTEIESLLKFRLSQLEANSMMITDEMNFALNEEITKVYDSIANSIK